MAKLPRVTQNIFASTPPASQEVTQFGSTYNGTTNYTSDVATIQALANWLQGWYRGAVAQSSPTIQDMNGLFLVLTQQLAYLFEQGVAEWDSATTYFSGSLVNNRVFVFTVSSANATVGATYTSPNGSSFTVQSTIVAGLSLTGVGSAAPDASGVLTKTGGTGDATITYSAYIVNAGIYFSIQDSNLNHAVTDTAYWSALTPDLGSVFQHLAVNSTGTAAEYTYNTINGQTSSGSATVPAGYNLLTGFLTVPTGVTYTVAGSMNCSGPLIGTGTGIVTATGTGIVRGN